VLFADASRVRFSNLREDLPYYVRLLAIGLPLTTALGTAAAVTILGLSAWYALLVGAALAPTDAALGSAVMSDRRVPYRVRQTLNVESGLNDGIATPIVTVAIAAIAARVGLGHEGLGHGLTGLVLGALTGAVLGALGGTLLRSAGRRGLGSEEFAGPSVLALALLAYLCATLADANGFVAAFAAGSAFGAFAGRGEEREVYYVEQTCGLASMICWLLGAMVFRRSPRAGAGESSHALLSPTVIRMVPVGARLDWPTVFFIGWFGPRTGLNHFRIVGAEDSTAYRPIERWSQRWGLTVLSEFHGLTAQPRYEAVCGHPATDRRRASGASAASVCEPVSKGVLIRTAAG
jgi:NhaP-type Na+/H+ or K+/H+ antiporter